MIGEAQRRVDRNFTSSDLSVDPKEVPILFISNQKELVIVVVKERTRQCA